MSVEIGVVERIKTSAICERFHGGRVFPGVAKQGQTALYVEVQPQGEDQRFTLSGPDGIPRARFQVNVWSQDWDDAREAAIAIQQRINGIRAYCGPVFVKASRASLAGVDDDDDGTGNDGRWWRRLIDLTVDYVESPAPQENIE